MGTAIAAVVLATISGLLVWRYVDGADERARADERLVEVLVAAGDIPAGTEGGADLFTTEEYPQRLVDDLILRAADAGAADGKFATGDIAAGTPIRADSFADRIDGDRQTLGLASGKQAVAISVDAPHGVAEFPRPGDTVNVLLSSEVKDLTAPDRPPLRTTAFLLSGVRVLAVGQTTAFGDQRRATTDTNGDGVIDDRDEPAADQAEQRGLLTLEVTARQAAQLAQAQTLGSISLTLNPPDFDAASFTSPEEIVELANLFDQPLARLTEIQAQVRQAPRG